MKMKSRSNTPPQPPVLPARDQPEVEPSQGDAQHLVQLYMASSQQAKAQQLPEVASWRWDPRESIGSGHLICGNGWKRQVMIGGKKEGK